MVTLPVRAVGKGEGVLAFAALLGIIVFLQILGGAYASGFGGYPDEPAHLVTSLMARDFLADLNFRHPMQFAQQFYYHYPEVAIGHWPPAFYNALGTWFLLVGASRGSAVLFIALVAATTASIIYFTGKRLIGRWAGVLAAVLFIASPLVQEASARVMSEHLVTLGMLVSTSCFARFARTERISDGLAFGIVAAVAILTHPNAWALGLVPGIAIALTNRWHLLRRPGLWLAALPVLAVCVPWYALTLGMAEDGLIAGAPLLSLAQVVGFGWAIYNALGLAVLLFAAIGLWTTIVQVERRSEVAPEWGALAGLAVAAFALHSIIPTGAESRYMVTVLPSVVLFSAAGAHEIVHLLRSGFHNYLWLI
jgi:4-amino-4-deoxy-L-arabinose transferase-like glycosyltransferase